MKICVMILAFGLVPKLERVVRAVDTLPTYILHPVESWWSSSMEDKVPEVAEMLKVQRIDIRADNETQARNQSISIARAMGYDYAILLDSDEVLEGVEHITDAINKRPTDSYVCRIVDYGFDDVTVMPQRNHRPLIMVDTRVDLKKHYFFDKRCFCGDLRELSPRIQIHHYSLSNTIEDQYKIDSPNYDDAYPPPEYRKYYINNGRVK